MAGRRVTYEQAQKLSAALVDACISHSLIVGYHQDMAQQVQCRVDLAMPRRYSGGLAAAFTKLEEIGKAHGLQLGTSIMGAGLTFSSEPAAAWPHRPADDWPTLQS